MGDVFAWKQNLNDLMVNVVMAGGLIIINIPSQDSLKGKFHNIGSRTILDFMRGKTLVGRKRVLFPVWGAKPMRGIVMSDEKLRV